MEGNNMTAFLIALATGLATFGFTVYRGRAITRDGNGPFVMLASTILGALAFVVMLVLLWMLAVMGATQ